MARSVTDIRDDIEAAVARRADLFARQAGAGWQRAEDLADERAGIEARLRGLWEELREARVEPVRRDRLTGDEARAMARGVARLALA